jgi:hypothetical protein
VTVASFDLTNGAYPDGGVTIDAQGNLYGTTASAGPGGLYNDLGTVWETAKGTDTITTFASFDVDTGYEPLSGVTLDEQGDLYGAAYYGGPGGEGTVWEHRQRIRMRSRYRVTSSPGCPSRSFSRPKTRMQM